MTQNDPKPGDLIGDRTIIAIKGARIIFGQREGNIPNCGAYVTDFREWFAYERDWKGANQNDN